MFAEFYQSVQAAKELEKYDVDVKWGQTAQTVTINIYHKLPRNQVVINPKATVCSFSKFPD
jgi:hypothetical protein